jgi:peptidoglycan-associated lipoprotein
VGKVTERKQCALQTVYFGFDQASLTSEANNTLNGNADTIKKVGGSVDLVGRADPRGTTEYNMALSDRRAQAVKDYLQRLGLDASKLAKVPRGALDATGSDESGWAKDRRVDFECR